jgi:hypothetical protein
VTFPIPSGSYYLRVSDNSFAPHLQRGDLLLVAPSTATPVDTLCICEHAGALSVCDVWEPDGPFRPVGARPDLLQPPVSPRGYVVQVFRVMSSGLKISLESELGMSRSMVDLTQSA